MEDNPITDEEEMPTALVVALRRVALPPQCPTCEAALQQGKDTLTRMHRQLTIWRTASWILSAVSLTGAAAVFVLTLRQPQEAAPTTIDKVPYVASLDIDGSGVVDIADAFMLRARGEDASSVLHYLVLVNTEESDAS